MKSLISILTIVLIFSCCSKKEDEQPTTPADQLPPATQIGANKVGCLVNGQVLLPYQKNPLGVPTVVCFYQYVNSQFDFSLGFSNDKVSGGIKGINVAAHKIEFQQGQTYQLKSDDGNSAFATYLDFSQNSDYKTTDLILGELRITKLDQTNAIISGTFWFDAINNAGVKVEVREGRFDMQYSQ